MSHGSAFQARGPAMENVSYMKPGTWNDEVAAHTGPKPGVVTAPDKKISQVTLVVAGGHTPARPSQLRPWTEPD